MLEPREADIPALFLVLVVLPLVAYILLGKWSEAAKKRERINLLAQLATEEGHKSQAMAVPDVIPIVSSPKNRLRACARCFNPATTRCARCKSVRYCSGKCQIIHWREVHKQECRQLETVDSISSPEAFSVEGSIHEILFFSDSTSSQDFGCNLEQNLVEPEPSNYMMHSSARTSFPHTADSLLTDASQISMLDKKIEKCASRKLRRKSSNASNSSEGVHGSRVIYSTPSDAIPSVEDFEGCKSRVSDPFASDDLTPEKHNFNISNGYINGHTSSSTTVHETYRYQRQDGNAFGPGTQSGLSCLSHSTKCGQSEQENGMSFIQSRENLLKWENTSNGEQMEPKCSELATLKGGTKANRAPYSLANKNSKLPKSTLKETGETHCSEKEKGVVAEESKFLNLRDSAIDSRNEIADPRMMKMMGLRKATKLTRQDAQVISSSRHKIKMLFPYEEFVKFFLCEVLDMSPQGLLNCGNSCYANAVLQCLTYTKPLTIYLLRRSHSRSCCGKDWCLMCELEQHVTMLRDHEGPLSPNRILSHLQSINCHIGDGNQEDAHEFLRLLVASMQSICLEGLGGENKVDPRLQETTFIQHTFGGNLRSKVKCLNCHHESERYENILDLTLEIYGWVESLEDALTQFTTPEDLDGENMYRCGRCSAYVRARKQLSIHEAPNILTIVLKRFQEGRYGKINKCISFPDMLDMIPFMTGTSDIPPLYILYAVVVHLDTLNASFSGHYVSYVKDLQGNWFRIDDAEVQPVPLSHVMSEGAYILFYMRSSPRPQNILPCRAKKPSRPVQKKCSSQFVNQVPHTDNPRHEIANHTSNDTLRRANRNVVSTMETYNDPIRIEFSDATSSDWSIFTSSDEASFTTDSARDSFSTVDYADTCNIEPISSIFHAMYAPEYSHIYLSSKKISNSRLHSRFVSEDLYLSKPVDRQSK